MSDSLMDLLIEVGKALVVLVVNAAQTEAALFGGDGAVPRLVPGALRSSQDDWGEDSCSCAYAVGVCSHMAAPARLWGTFRRKRLTADRLR